MIIPLEDRWGFLAVLEYEHGARETLLSVLREGELRFKYTQPPDQEEFIRNTAASYASQSFRQAKEFFRHAESSSWLVKPLLLYYGMLAATKACLTFVECDFFLDHLRHGVSREKTKTPADLSTDNVRLSGEGVYQLARKALWQKRIADQQLIPISEILRRLPDSINSYVLFTNDVVPQLIPATVPQPTTTTPCRIAFEMPQTVVAANASVLPGSLLSDFNSEILHPPGNVRYISKAAWPGSLEAGRAIQYGIVRALAISGNTAALILPIEIDGVRHEFTELELLYLVTFYFSEIARYSPHSWLRMHSGQENLSVLLCQDVIRVCENKFLQLLQNKMIYAVLAPFSRAVQPGSSPSQSPARTDSEKGDTAAPGA